MQLDRAGGGRTGSERPPDGSLCRELPTDGCLRRADGDRQRAMFAHAHTSGVRLCCSPERSEEEKLPANCCCPTRSAPTLSFRSRRHVSSLSGRLVMKYRRSARSSCWFVFVLDGPRFPARAAYSKCGGSAVSVCQSCPLSFTFVSL